MTMDIASLSPLFAPRTVAVIGASTDPVKIGGRPISYLKAKGFGGRIIPVNPKAKEIQGLPVHPTITDVDCEVDLAICAASTP
jgi:acetate---CoA ligase (ADP-forming)